VTLQDLGSIGEFVAAIATLITLIYLAVQIRQNTKTIQTSTYQTVNDASNEIAQLILAHPHLERAFAVGRRDPSKLTEEERRLFSGVVGQLLLNYEMMFLQHQRGVIDDDFWRGRRSVLRRLLSAPGVRDLWVRRPDRGEIYVTAFRELVESLLDEIATEDEPAA
jgi:hypothetical protein